MKQSNLVREFLHSEKTGGIVLMVCTVFSLIIANSFLGSGYQHLIHYEILDHPAGHWINDGLMAIFFLLIGLELEREVYIGELSNFKKALFPVFGALGGMLLPAGIYYFFNHDTSTHSGIGIPMATDIAFALAVLSLLGNRVPPALKIFLTALAVMDDLGAIIIIAIFYTKTLVWFNLMMALGIFMILLLLNRLKVYKLLPYIAGGVFMWYFMLNSGVHATITGVLLAFAIPFGKGDSASPSYRLQHFLHKPVAFIILPLFAMANTAVELNGELLTSLSASYSLGIAIGLTIGKPLGIFLFTYLAVMAGFCKLPDQLSWKSIFSVGLLGGIGFTMSVFIALLAFDTPHFIETSKLTILISSLSSGICGFAALAFVFSKKSAAETGT